MGFSSRVRRTMTPAMMLAILAGCASGASQDPTPPAPVTPTVQPPAAQKSDAPVPDPRVGLRAGDTDAGEALWNMVLLSNTRSPDRFAGSTNSDLAFFDKYAIQGNYNGFVIWDISNPRQPTVRKSYYCPASQSDVSVYRNLLFVSGEGTGGRLDCGGQGVPEPVSKDRLRGLRIFDISDLDNPKYIANVQTCRGSHTHTVVESPNDPNNVYIYISGSARVRPEQELPGCSAAQPENDPNTALFRIEVIRVPLANPEQAAIVSSPRIFNDLEAPPTHGETPEDLAAARDRGDILIEVSGMTLPLPARFAQPMLDSIVKTRGGTGTPTAADTAALREMVARMIGADPNAARRGPNQCHDITVYPAVGLAGGACEGYGLLLDIRDPANPVRLDAVADSNFSYWHSATFSNDGTKVLFSDEWGGGGGPKCRATDPKEWGADAIFTISGNKMQFQSYYKMPAAQTWEENCVAHNGSLIPVPGREIMVQAWYQGGISVFDWTDPKNPYEIAFFDRGPIRADQMGNAGSWSAYWYNGVIVSSEIGRGLDILELTPSTHLTQNEIDAAKTVRLDYLNVQGQPKFTWPASFALARAYLDQLERHQGLAANRIAAIRQALASAEQASGTARSQALTQLASQVDGDAANSRDAAKVRMLATAIRDLSR